MSEETTYQWWQAVGGWVKGNWRWLRWALLAAIVLVVAVAAF